MSKNDVSRFPESCKKFGPYVTFQSIDNDVANEGIIQPYSNKYPIQYTSKRTTVPYTFMQTTTYVYHPGDILTAVFEINEFEKLSDVSKVKFNQSDFYMFRFFQLWR